MIYSCPHHFCRIDSAGRRYCCRCGQPAPHDAYLIPHTTTADNRVPHWYVRW